MGWTWTSIAFEADYIWSYLFIDVSDFKVAMVNISRFYPASLVRFQTLVQPYLASQKSGTYSSVDMCGDTFFGHEAHGRYSYTSPEYRHDMRPICTTKLFKKVCTASGKARKPTSLVLSTHLRYRTQRAPCSRALEVEQKSDRKSWLNRCHDSPQARFCVRLPAWPSIF